MIVGFSGSREGMTMIQREKVKAVLSTLLPEEAHHGDCVGSDEGFHELCRELTREQLITVYIVVHPPMADQFRAFCEGDETRPPKAYIGRNRDIVSEVGALIACPKQELQPPELRGHGTWSTIRYATGRIPIYLIKPSGELSRR